MNSDVIFKVCGSKIFVTVGLNLSFSIINIRGRRITPRGQKDLDQIAGQVKYFLGHCN